MSEKSEKIGDFILAIGGIIFIPACFLLFPGIMMGIIWKNDILLWIILIMFLISLPFIIIGFSLGSDMDKGWDI